MDLKLQFSINKYKTGVNFAHRKGSGACMGGQILLEGPPSFEFIAGCYDPETG
jgi:hypothetical protein